MCNNNYHHHIYKQCHITAFLTDETARVRTLFPIYQQNCASKLYKVISPINIMRQTAYLPSVGYIYSTDEAVSRLTSQKIERT